MNGTKKPYLHAVPTEPECDTVPLSEVDEQLNDLTNANSYLHSIITDLERALVGVLRDNYTEKCCESVPEQPLLVPIADSIRTNVRSVQENSGRIRTIINRLGV